VVVNPSNFIPHHYTQLPDDSLIDLLEPLGGTSCPAWHARANLRAGIRPDQPLRLPLLLPRRFNIALHGLVVKASWALRT